jgi:hypothetical protein
MNHRIAFTVLLTLLAASVTYMVIRPSGFIGMIFGGMKPSHNGIDGLYVCPDFYSDLKEESVYKKIRPLDTMICGSDTITVTFETAQANDSIDKVKIIQIRINGKPVQDEDESLGIAEKYCECFTEKLRAN